MSVKNLHFVDALIVQYSVSSGAYYAYSSGLTDDIIIDCCYCPQDVDLLGKWIDVGIDERNRARHLIKVIDDKFLTRILRGLVEVKVEIQHDGCTAQNIQMFKNDYFGYICDVRKILHDIRDGANYHVWIIRHKEDGLVSRWRISTEQDNIQPYFLNSEKNLDIVTGVVTSYAKIGNFYLVWSAERPRSTICLDYSFCPPNVDMLGKWAEMKVNKAHRVQKPIVIIRDLFETRAISRLTEFRIDFQHIKRYRQDFEMFHHDYFGEISDSAYLLDNVEKGAWYNGWIVYSQHSGANTCWRLAINQKIQGPFRHRPTNSQDRTDKNFNDPLMSHNNSHGSRRRSRSADREYNARRRVMDADYSYKQTRRSTSPDIRNAYDEDLQCEDTTYQSMKNEYQEPTHSGYRGHTEIHPNDNSSRNINSRDPRRRSISPKRIDRVDTNPLRCRDSPSPIHQVPTKAIQKERHQSHLPAVMNFSALSSSITPREKVSSSPRGNRSTIYRTDTTDSEYDGDSTNKIGTPVPSRHKRYTHQNVDNQEGSSLKSQNINQIIDAPGNCSFKEVEDIKILIQKPMDSSNKMSYNPYGNLPDVVHPKTSNPVGQSLDTAQDKEIRLLKSKIARMSGLVKSLTTDDSVSIPMRLWSLEEYEELMDLAKKHT